MPADRKLNLAIGLPLRNAQELNDTLQQIYDPSSTNFHQFLSPGEFTKRFGPTEEDYQKVIEFAQTNDLEITGVHPNRMLLDVSGSVAGIEKALRVKMLLFKHPAEQRSFFAPNDEPALPGDAHILHISGLDDYIIPHPASLRPSPLGATGPTPEVGPGSGPSGSYRGSDFRNVYTRNISLNGSGQMVGLMEFDGFYAADITSYLSQSSVPSVPVTTVLIDHFDGTPGTNNIEVALDIELVTSMAPKLAGITVYEARLGTPTDDLLNPMANDNTARQLSASWTFPVDATTEQIFMQFAAQGQSYFNASGDNGAYSGSVLSPADDPNITVVGGTELTTTGPGGAWKSETVWNRGFSDASGGGISTVYPIPAWQKPVNMSANQGSTLMRNLPDVAAVAENIWVVYGNGTNEVVDGTSASSPLWAGFTALINQQAAGYGKPPVGFLNPAIYAIGLSTNYTSDFHDITNGDNTTPSSPSEFFAVPGYDLCTGWGSPVGQNLINALAPRVQAPLITNASTFILSEGCPNGWIDPDETVTVNFSLKNLGAFSTTNLVATMVADSGVYWPSSPQSYGVLAGGGATAGRAFTFTAKGTCGATLPVTLQLSDGAASLGNLIFNFPLGQPQTPLTQNFDSVVAPSLPAGWITTASNGVSLWVASTNFYDTPPNAAFADEPASAGTEDLISPPISITSPAAQLSFRNYYNSEADPTVASRAYDGGVLEIQVGTNAFADILDAGGAFISGGYNRTIYTGTNGDNPFAGRQAWGGNSTNFINTLVALPASAEGQTIQLRWRFGLDTGNLYGGSGWYIDTISITDATCCVSSADLAVDLASMPPAIVPGQMLSYSVSVTNQGPSSAFGVYVSNLLPTTVVFNSGSDGCTFTNGVVVCEVGTLPANSATNYTFDVIPTTTDSITNVCGVWSFTPDSDASNNEATSITTVATNTPPVVYLQPTNAVAVTGDVATLQAKAYGVAPIAFQWFFNNAAIAGQTLPSLSLTNAQPAQSGAYSVVVTNVYGATTSSPAQLFIVVPPTIQVAGLDASTGNIAISFSSDSRLIYTLEYKNSLSDPAWIPILPPVNGTGAPMSVSDTNTVGMPARFYRITAQ